MIDNALKAIDVTDDELIVANYIVLFGGRDLEWVRSGRNPDGSLGEYFTKSTALDSPYTQAGMFHVDWEHGEGKALDGKDAPDADDVLGYVNWKTARQDDRGWWVERVLSRRNSYVKWLEELIRAGLLGTSSEAIPGKVVKAKSGEIKNWPLMRDTLTAQPAEPRMMTENVLTAVKYLAGKLDVPGLSEGPTLAQKTAGVTAELGRLFNDFSGLVDGIDQPLTDKKRLELEALLETFSGLDAVRSDLTSVLAAAPIGTVAARRLSYELAERRKRLGRILEETI